MAALLDIPVLATRHVPKAFGDVVEEISSLNHPGRQLFDKHTFSMVGCEDLKQELQKQREAGRCNVVVYGTETHVCIKQTCFDLLLSNFSVAVPVDCITSITTLDHEVALRSLEKSQIDLTTFQSLVFELLRDSKHPKFKDMLAIVKDSPPVKK